MKNGPSMRASAHQRLLAEAEIKYAKKIVKQLDRANELPEEISTRLEKIRQQVLMKKKKTNHSLHHCDRGVC